MPAITSQNISQAIAKLIAVNGLPMLISNLKMGQLVNRDFDPVVANSGDVINVPIPPDLVANNIAESGSVQAQNPSLGNAQIVLNSHVEASFIVPDVTKAIASIDLMSFLMAPAMKAIATRIEADLLGLWPLFTANAAVGGTSAMDEARIDSAETALFTALVPDEQKYLIVHQTPFSAMRQTGRMTEFQNVGQTGGIIDANLPGAGPLGANGRIKDFLVFRSQNVPFSTTYKNLAFHKNAIGLVIRRLPQPMPGTGAIAEYAELANFGLRVVMSYAPNTLAQQFTVDCLYGCGPLRNTHAVTVLST